MQNHEILEDLWDRSEGTTVFLPTMGGTIWSEGGPFDKHNVPFSSFEGLSTYNDVYFTPHAFHGPFRRKGYLAPPAVIYADLDGDHITEPRLKPSLIVATSRSHYHAYWYLDQAYPAADWERAAKGWSKEIGADPGGWDATQVLRLPVSQNHKYGATPFMVYPQLWEPSREYALEDFPDDVVRSGSVAQAEPVPSKDTRDFLIMQGIADDSLPLGARYWLTATPEQIAALGKIDRSKVMWQVEKSLVSAGYSPYDIYQLMFFSGINKFRGRPDRLWYEVNKAAEPV